VNKKLGGLLTNYGGRLINTLIEITKKNKLHLCRTRHDTSRAEILRPGFTRLSLAFYLAPRRVQFVLDAVRFVCAHGWQFLPLYVFSLETGEWRHRGHQAFRDRKWLGHVGYAGGRFSFADKFREQREGEPCPGTEEVRLASWSKQLAHLTSAK
jgi:hypothetical protein